MNHRARRFCYPRAACGVALALLCALTAALSSLAMAEMNPDDDPYLWLEEVQGDRALAWVRERNADSRKVLEAWPDFAGTRTRMREVLDSRERIPTVTRRGPWLYNFWQDVDHPRGVWRRTTMAEYRKAQPAWDVLIDLDALGRDEHENWVWAGAACLRPADTRCLLKLSRGGADANVVREYDLAARRFVGDGFVLPEAKTDIDWLDLDTVLVATDFGAGSLTESGYPRVVKRWRRGHPLAQASTVFEGQTKDVAAGFTIDLTPGFERVVVNRQIDFYNAELGLLQGDRVVPIERPSDTQLTFWRDHMLLELRSDWTVNGATHRRGSLLLAPAPPTSPDGASSCGCSSPRRRDRWRASRPRARTSCSTSSTTWPAACRSGARTKVAGAAATSRRRTPAPSASRPCTTRCSSATSGPRRTGSSTATS